MKIDITEDQIQKLLEDVKVEFAELQKSEEAALAKSEEESKKEASEKKEDSKKESPMEKDFPPEEKPDVAPEAPAEEVAPEAPAEDPAAEGDVSPDQLFDMYSKLSDEDLSMHYMACSKALFAKMEAPPEEEVAVAAAPEVAPDAPAPAPMEVAKSNKVAEEMLEAFKTVENENKSLKDESQKLQKKIDEMAEVLGKLVAKPARSGFASGTVIEAPAKSASALTKSQIMTALSKKAQDMSLSKEDQEKVMRYSLNPVFTEELSKFLEEKQK